jgi:hypothetical protein
VFWPRCAVVINARSVSPPAKTISRGSSPTYSVRTTRGGLVVTSTILTLSERWLTTQTWPLLLTPTATGSRPTATDSTWFGTPLLRLNISRWLSGVLTAYKIMPSADIANGLTWPLSKVTNAPTAGGVAGSVEGGAGTGAGAGATGSGLLSPPPPQAGSTRISTGIIILSMRIRVLAANAGIECR